VSKEGGYCGPNSTGETEEYDWSHAHLEIAGAAHPHVCNVDAIRIVILK